MTLDHAPAHDPGEDLFGHPKGLYVCFFTEMWERFSFYGMKALLALYLIKHHGFSDTESLTLVGAYGGLVYATPVLGGILMFFRPLLVGIARALVLVVRPRPTKDELAARRKKRAQTATTVQAATADVGVVVSH